MLYQLILKNNIIVISKRDTVDSRKTKKSFCQQSFTSVVTARGVILHLIERRLLCTLMYGF